MFVDRTDAGSQLAAALLPLVEDDAVVLGIPRGGVVVAAPVAAALRAPLDVALTRKLGAPGNPELAVGAVAPGVRVVSERVVRRLGVDPAYLDAEVARQEVEIARRAGIYRAGRPGVALRGRVAVVVDDGIATGATAVAALRWARAEGASRTWFAAPVGPTGVQEQLASECDRCIVLETPSDLRAVGAWYRHFTQTTDAEVTDALAETVG
jgi:putative phosphoribosyl transferase